MKTGIVFFILGMGQGALALDWLRDKQALKIATKRKK